MKLPTLLFSILLVVFSSSAQTKKLSQQDINRLLQIPRQYTILKTKETITIDGKMKERSWAKAPWTEMFTGITGDKKEDPIGNTRCKLLWDDHFLYLYAELKEPDIRSAIKIHDQQVYQGNAFELFIDPDGSTHNYFEFQINAYGTVCDLFLPKPYRNGGSPLLSWDMKGLKKAIALNGTINNPSDTDSGWSIELAIPFNSIAMNYKQHPETGTIWRMNFSRVEWEVNASNGKYIRKRDIKGKSLPAHYWVWSPQGIVNLHYPERWGYVQFSEKLSPSGFLSVKDEKTKLLMWKYYYLQHNFKAAHGRYASSLRQLHKAFPKETVSKDRNLLHLEATKHQFWIQGYLPSIHMHVSVNEDGKFKKKKMP